MNEENRPSPEELLEAVKREEKQLTKGKLKIFLGMAAGVGKTYAMLEEAGALQREGIDLVVGTVNTHGRADTALLLKDLKIIPEKSVAYREKEFHELDSEKIIEIQPRLVIIDELAHSNVPGLTHTKRWQDVLEFLEHGIDVYTTLNVQHIESLNDVVERITGIAVKETVPDLMIDIATSIRLIDITPDELLQRLKEGKVYLGDQSQIAASHFFQKDRLTALREISLRYAAEKVDHDLHNMISRAGLATDWKPREKILVAISPSPHSQRLIRTTRRLAFNLDASWIAVYIDDGLILDERGNSQLIKNLNLARELGAEVITTNDPDIASGLQRIAQQRKVTQIIMGRSHSRSLFSLFKGSSLLEKLVKECHHIDIHVIRQEQLSFKYRKKRAATSLQNLLYQYLFMFFCVFLLTVINWMALPFIGYKITGFIFLLGILTSSLVIKKGPILFASLLYATIWGFLFIPEIDNLMTFHEDSALLVLFVLTAIATGVLHERAREHKAMLAKREESAQALYDIVRLIASAPSTDQIFKSIKGYLEKFLNGSVEIIIKQINNGLIVENHHSLISDVKEKSAVMWVFENGKEAGWSTSTLPSVKNLYIPLKGFHEVVGVLAYRPKTKKSLNTEEMNFINTVTQQLSHYVERTFIEERERRIARLNQEEQVYEEVLQSISHELQHPFVVMQEKIHNILHPQDEEIHFKGKPLERQIHKIETSSEGLIHILENTSAMVKLSGKFIPIKKSMHDMKEVIDHCCEKMQKNIGSRKLQIVVDEKLPLVSFDLSLIKTLLNNFIFNAIEYSPKDSTIEIDACKREDHCVLSVTDEGAQIPIDLLEQAFDNFNRLSGFTPSDMGVGLTIAKEIAEAHGGYLKAEQCPKVIGMKFSLFLPLDSHTSSLK